MELLSSLLSSMRTLDPETLDQEYNVVRSQASVLKRELGLTTLDGSLKENIKKNRYKDIIPFDQSRVVLSQPITDCDSDYINASFIKGVAAGRSYIASQAPLSSTVIDFWRMIRQHDVKVIVMACREIEMGKKKCECYWPPVHQSAAFGPFTVYNQGETRPTEDLVVRTLTVTYQQDSRFLVQYQFLSWPDHDIPTRSAGVLDLLERVRNSQGTHTSPLLIHCSAGCGRTGVICALDYIHDLLVTKKITPNFSIMKVVLELRTQRPSAVQTKDQYRFIFVAVALMLERALQPAPRSLPSPLAEKPETKTTGTPAATTNRLSLTDMNDTYAVVNKPKQPRPPPQMPAPSIVPRSNSASRTPPQSHHYDNDPVYSTVRPRTQRSPAPASGAAMPADHEPGEGLLSAAGDNGEYHLSAAERLPPADVDYEDFSDLCSPGGIGFNCRVQKPKGPREPPAEWSRLER